MGAVQNSSQRHSAIKKSKWGLLGSQAFLASVSRYWGDFGRQDPGETGNWAFTFPPALLTDYLGRGIADVVAVGRLFFFFLLRRESFVGRIGSGEGAVRA